MGGSSGQTQAMLSGIGVFPETLLLPRGNRTGVVVLTNSFNGPRAYRDIIPVVIGGEHPALARIEKYRL
jgi:hypothetical protein